MGSSTPAPQALGRGKGEAKGILQQLAHFQKLNTVSAFIGNKICFVDNDLKPCIFFQDFIKLSITTILVLCIAAMPSHCFWIHNNTWRSMDFSFEITAN